MNRVIRRVCIILISCWGYVMGIVHDYRTGLKKIRYLDRWNMVVDIPICPVSSPSMRKCEPLDFLTAEFSWQARASPSIVGLGVFSWLIRNIAKWIANDVDLFREMRRESSFQAFIEVYHSFFFLFFFLLIMSFFGRWILFFSSEFLLVF